MALIAGLLTIAVFCIAIFAMWLHKEEQRPRVLVKDGVLFAGRKQLSIPAIAGISIAPMYDVAPADDLWILEGRDGFTVSFFNRVRGAHDAVQFLKVALPGFDPEAALSKARDETFFEQPVSVWKVS